jgi:hypothetical protein
MTKWTITNIHSKKSELALAHPGAKMDLAGRNRQKGRVAVENITRALPRLMGRVEPAASAASQCFLVALFFLAFIGSYFANPLSKTRPQNSVNPDVENHPPKPAIVLVNAGVADASDWNHVIPNPQNRNHRPRIAITR